MYINSLTFFSSHFIQSVFIDGLKVIQKIFNAQGETIVFVLIIVNPFLKVDTYYISRYIYFV